MYKLRRRLVAYMDIHVYGQLWMSPWGYTHVVNKHYDKQIKTMREIKSAILKEQNVVYKVGSSASILYQTSGDSLDWVYGRLGIVHSYGVELRPTMNHRRGFRYSSNATIPTGQDLMVGVLTLSKSLLREK